MEAFFESIGRRGDTFNLVEYVKGENLQEFDDNGVDYNQLFNTTNRDPSCRFSAPEDGQYWVMISDRYQRGGAVFFFSSRRRHTRWNCDWSSDVCSSDLRWRTRISPAWTDWPPKRLTPSRCAVELRPLRELDAPFL